LLSGQRREEITSVEEVLELDNSPKSKIHRLLITCSASTDGAARPENEIQVDFDGRIVNKTKVIVSVRSENAGWCDRALSSVEEQIERTPLRDTSHRVALIGIAVSVIFFLLFLLLSSLSASNAVYGDADVMWLRTTNMDRVEQILNQGRTITDEEMLEINTMQLRNLLEDIRKAQPSGWNRQKTYIGVPLLIVLGCAVYLLIACYPTAVFLWGDEIERYNKMILTRRIVWGFITGGIGFGLLSKLLYAGLVSGP
jgi:hypothetical protein